MPYSFNKDIFEGKGERDNNDNELEDSLKDVFKGDRGDLV